MSHLWGQKWSESSSVVSDSLRPHGLYSPWNFPGQNTGMGSHSLLQGIFPTQGSNPGLPHCRKILYRVSHQGSPKILEWVAYPFSSGTSQSRNQTGVSYMAGGFFTSWATELHGIHVRTERKDVFGLWIAYNFLVWNYFLFIFKCPFKASKAIWGKKRNPNKKCSNSCKEIFHQKIGVGGGPWKPVLEQGRQRNRETGRQRDGGREEEGEVGRLRRERDAPRTEEETTSASWPQSICHKKGEPVLHTDSLSSPGRPGREGEWESQGSAPSPATRRVPASGTPSRTPVPGKSPQ